MSRRNTVLPPERVAALWAEYQDRPFNISARARELGVLPCTLSYHLRGGKVGRILSGRTWRAVIYRAHRAFRHGDRGLAAA